MGYKLLKTSLGETAYEIKHLDKCYCLSIENNNYVVVDEDGNRISKDIEKNIIEQFKSES